MNNATLDKLIWVLIYGGLLGVCLGIFIGQRDGDFGGWVIAGGTFTAAAGAFLIWVRSRREG